MKIKLTISTDCLGDFNTAEDNRRYAAAVQTAIQSEYPDADVSVALVTNVSAGSCWIDDDPTGEIEENVKRIAAHVWEYVDYWDHVDC